MCRTVVIIRNMRNVISEFTAGDDDNYCTCPRCVPEAWSLTTAQIVLRVLIGVALGVMTCAKGLQLGIAPTLVYAVSGGEMLYVAWALTRYQPSARRWIGRKGTGGLDTR